MLGWDLYLYGHRRLDADAAALADDAGASRHARPELADHGQDRRWIHVDPAHYEHVVSAAEAAHAKAGPAAGARRALDPYDVATQKAHHGHRLTRQARVNHLADGARLDHHRLSCVEVDELGPDLAGATEVHSLLMRALAEQRRRHVSDAHDLGDGCAQCGLDVVADRRYATARFTAGDDVDQCRGARVHLALLQSIGDVLSEGRRGQECVGKAGPEAEENPVCVAGRHRNGADSKARQHEVRVPGHERAGPERGQHAVMVVDAGRVVAARSYPGPRLDVGGREGDDARISGSTAGLVDAFDRAWRDADVGPEGGLLVDRPLEVVFRSERQLRDVRETHARLTDPGLAKPARIKRRPLHQAAELGLPHRGGPGQSVGGGSGFEFALPDPVPVAVIASQAAARLRRIAPRPRFHRAL